MRYLPIHVDLQDEKVLIVGGGAAAEAKLRTLLKTEAALVLVAPEISPEIQKWVDNDQINWYRRDLVEQDYDGVTLVYAATDAPIYNSEIATQCKVWNILVNAADQKADCSFITPALVDRSPVTISIGTEGTSPGLARAIKSDLETRLPSTLGSLAKFVAKARKRVALRIPDLAGRQRFWAD